MAHLLRLLVPLFLGVHASPLPLSAYNSSMCLESFRCGGVDIRYPFYLSNATQATPDNTFSYSCGYTDLKIFCQGEGKNMAPVLHLEGDTYTILNISYHNHTIILGDADLLPGDGCPRVSHNVSLGQAWLSYTDSSFGSLKFFFDCYGTPGEQPPPGLVDTYQINCSPNPSAGTGDGVSFVFISGSEEHNVSQEHDLAGHCSKMFVVPVRKDALVRRKPFALPSDYGAVLKQGFELGWNLSTAQPWCHQCENSNGRCAYSENKAFLGCLCSGGKVGLQDCNDTSASTASTSSESKSHPPPCE